MMVTEIDFDEMPRHVGLSLAQLGAVFREGATKKAPNEYGLDWLETPGWCFGAVRAYLRLGLAGMDAFAKGGSEIPAIMEYSFKHPSKAVGEKVETEWVYTRAGIFKKEVSDVRWRGEAGLASRLNAEAPLQQKLLWMNGILKGIFDKVYVEQGEVRFRFNTLMKRKGLLSTKRTLYCILPSRELFEAADSVCKAL